MQRTVTCTVIWFDNTTEYPNGPESHRILPNSDTLRENSSLFGHSVVVDMSYLWTTLLYTPLLNVLIFLYERLAGNNLGLAVVELTIALRILLLPLSILSERNALAYERLGKQINIIDIETKNDSVLRRERIRELLRERGINPWAKALVLGIQALVLVLLYQVFLGGINFTKLTHLYSWVPAPDYINLDFLGFNIAERNPIAAGIVGIILFAEISITQRRAPGDTTRPDLIFRLLFPAFVFAVLWLLPVVKSVFILTSLMFGFLLTGFRRVIYPIKSNGGDTSI